MFLYILCKNLFCFLCHFQIVYNHCLNLYFLDFLYLCIIHLLFDEYFCDQLFYHIKLKCYVVVELKIVKFEPEFVSKLNFYCNAVNHLIKAPEENDTIGLLICKKKNDLVVQWTVEKNMEPIAITSYELSQIMDASLKGR